MARASRAPLAGEAEPIPSWKADEARHLFARSRSERYDKRRNVLYAPQHLARSVHRRRLRTRTLQLPSSSLGLLCPDRSHLLTGSMKTGSYRTNWDLED